MTNAITTIVPIRNSVFKGRKYPFTLDGEYNMTNGTAVLRKVHLDSKDKTSAFRVRMRWHEKRDKRMLVYKSPQKSLMLVQVKIYTMSPP